MPNKPFGEISLGVENIIWCQVETYKRTSRKCKFIFNHIERQQIDRLTSEPAHAHMYRHMNTHSYTHAHTDAHTHACTQAYR